MERALAILAGAKQQVERDLTKARADEAAAREARRVAAAKVTALEADLAGIDAAIAAIEAARVEVPPA